MIRKLAKLKTNKELWEPYWVREQVIDAIRAYFKVRGFHEVETPLLLKAPSTEPFLEVFETSLTNDLGQSRQAFLPTSPEFAMKKLLCAGSGSIFQLTKSFRNGEGASPRHNPEFTILEWYETPGDYMSVAKDFEKLMKFILQKIAPDSSKLSYKGKEYDLSRPWEKISVAQAFSRYAGIDTETMLSEAKLKEQAKQKGYQVTPETTWEQVWNQIIANEIEPKLGLTGPTILYDYPISQAALAKKASDGRFAERWEVFMAGMELGNCFSELSDAQEQEARCEADLLERKKLGRREYPLDQDFIEALKMGLPDTGGIAVGVDRLAMLFADADSIDEVIFFPASEIFV